MRLVSRVLMLLSSLLLGLLLGLFLQSCDDGDGMPDGAGGGGGAGGEGGAGGSGGAPPNDVEYLTRLTSSDDYAAVAGDGAEVKYLTTVDDRTPLAAFDGAECLFQNTHEYAYHLAFLRTFPEHSELDPGGYEDLVLRRSSRVMWGGGLKLFAATPHPRTNEAGVLSYTMYSGAGPDEQLRVEEVIELDRRLKRCIPYAAELLVFVADGAAQLAHIRTIQPELEAADVDVVEQSTLRPGLSAEMYVEGEGFGYLHIAPMGIAPEWVGPRDVLIAESPPADLAVVAALITALPQSLGSHVNLRLSEKGIPSASVPSIYDNAVVLGLAERLVHVVVTAQSVTVEPARLTDAQAFWDKRRPDVGEPQADLSVTEYRPLTELRADAALAYGVKVANLGELHGMLDEDNRVEGFGIPFGAYARFVHTRGLDVQVEDVLADAELYTNAEHKRSRLSSLRAAMRSAELLPDFASALEAAITASYGSAGLRTRLRFRSSTNAEDLTGLTGAGLYDSASGCLADDLDDDEVGPSACLSDEQQSFYESERERRRGELVEYPERSWLVDIIQDLDAELSEEKSAYRAVRKVWASLWNERAFDDREYYGIDHEKVFMGMAVHPAFVGEELEAVAVTHLEPGAAQPLYRVVSQVGEVGVVAPADPNAVPETLTFRRSAEDEPSDITLVRPASLSPGGAPLWSGARFDGMAALLFLVHDHFASEVYTELEPLSLDIELDVTHDGRTVIKQVRPYISLGP